MASTLHKNGPDAVVPLERLSRVREKGDYHLKYHDDEVARCMALHETLVDAMGKLVYAPVDLGRRGLRILDSGTGNAQWLVDLEQSLGGKDDVLIGADQLDKFYPPSPPKGISLKVQRMDTAWPRDWLESFDYVHQRLVLPGCDLLPPATAIRNMCELVKPGGWIELLEHDHNAPGAGGMETLESLMREIFTINGFGYDYPLRMKEWLEEAGMKDVHQEIIDIPLGALCHKPEMAQKSVYHVCSAARGFLPMARALPVSMTPDEMDRLPEHIAEELTRIGGIQRMYIVYGRKPS